MEKIKGQINSAGIHTECGQPSIEYGIANGSYWYYCHECKKEINKGEVERADS